MKSYAIGVAVAGVVAWFGTMDAQAQGINITVTGPTAVHANADTIEFSGTVTGYETYQFRVWAYLNGALVHDSMTLCYTGSTATYFFYTPENWGMQGGDELKFKCRVWVNLSTYHLVYHTLTVQSPQTYLQPSDAPDRQPAGGSGVLYAAVLRSDEQELLA